MTVDLGDDRHALEVMCAHTTEPEAVQLRILYIAKHAVSTVFSVPLHSIPISSLHQPPNGPIPKQPKAPPNMRIFH